MASACVNKIGMSTDTFFDFPSSSYGWLSPRISFSREEDSSSKSKITTGKNPDPEISGKEMGDFEFRLEEDPVKMLPADELFSDGKLVPLQIRHFVDSKEIEESTDLGKKPINECVRSSSSSVSWASDPYLFSPKAPRCSSRWKELLGLKKQQQNKQDVPQTQKVSCSKNPNPSRSLKYFLHRNNSPKPDSLPLLKDIDIESLSLSSSRFSLSSSSSSGPDQEDLPRLSLDSDKPRNPPPLLQPMKVKLERKPKPKLRDSACKTSRAASADHPITVRVGRSAVRSSSNNIPSRGVSVDSPRMNSSGKIVFQSLERSSSSPSSFNGGPTRIKARGMERSYSANVRVTPVLNVPVCSLRGSSKSGSVFGFGQLFSSPQKRDLSTRTQSKRNRI